jgi:hypothetical protein
MCDYAADGYDVLPISAKTPRPAAASFHPKTPNPKP